jgi:hypothetical protein
MSFQYENPHWLTRLDTPKHRLPNDGHITRSQKSLSIPHVQYLVLPYVRVTVAITFSKLLPNNQKVMKKFHLFHNTTSPTEIRSKLRVQFKKQKMMNHVPRSER